MSTETPSTVAASPVREAQPFTPSPSTVKLAPKRKVAKKTSAQDDLEEARKAIKAGQEAEVKALAKIEKERKAVCAKNGRESVADLVARLDKTTREMVVGNLLGVAKGEEGTNLQEWVETL